MKLSRVAGFQYDYAIFTNLEPDHIGPGEHESMEEYIQCKGMLFRNCKIGIANADADYLEQVMAGHTCQLETFGMGENADLRARNVQRIHQPGYLGRPVRPGTAWNTIPSMWTFPVTSPFTTPWPPSPSAVHLGIAQPGDFWTP